MLKLDATVDVPLDLTNVGQSLDVILGKESTGPPGKFFQDTNALKLLDTVRTGGPSARAAISDGATEEEKAHFARFRSRLNQGELVRQYQCLTLLSPNNSSVHGYGRIGFSRILFLRNPTHAATQPAADSGFLSR